MSPESKKGDKVNLEIDGIPCTAPKGSMIIQVADELGVVIPRFCYHKELSIAANCRMCLVEVEKVGKPLPACATPVGEGMKVYTSSPKAIAAQRAVVEFLLINHPLDCPVCDQGGECPLQEQALGFGSGVSRFYEGKRVVRDKDIGPLVATSMTRCIQCTRCIRFLDEVAGVHELGGVGRGEHMEISNYVEQSLTSELSGNIIDLCPVGALLSKPYLNTARPWELTAFASVAPHDSIGSHLEAHVRGGRVMRILPRENPAINNIWLSDRDRFSYQGLYSEDRLQSPMIKRQGVWQEVAWEEALEHTAQQLKTLVQDHGPSQLGALVAPTATVEEAYLTQKLMRGLGSSNIDHRLRQGDFSDDGADGATPWLGQSLTDLERVDAALLIGSDIRREQPLAAYRLRRAALSGASIMCVNPMDYGFHFPVAARSIGAPADMLRTLAKVCRALLEGDGQTAESMGDLLKGIEPGAAERAMAAKLASAERSAVLLGNFAAIHPHFSVLRSLATTIARLSGANMGYLPEAANSVGAWLAGALPHRTPGAAAAQSPGLNAHAMLASRLKAYLLLGTEPELDCWDSALAREALHGSDLVIGLTAFRSQAMEDYADILLPIAAFAETGGTLVNAEGRWQSFTGIVAPPGEARPGWKVMRVLGNVLGLEGFEYDSFEAVRDELQGACPSALASPDFSGPLPNALPEETAGLLRLGAMAPYACDPLARRAPALQETPDGRAVGAYMREELASALGIVGKPYVLVEQGESQCTLPLVLDETVPQACVWIPAGVEESAGLGSMVGPLVVEGVDSVARRAHTGGADVPSTTRKTGTAGSRGQPSAKARGPRRRAPTAGVRSPGE